MKSIPSYSIVIRTLGNTGEKYRQMLDCIAKQTITPEEVIVVIPFGYELDHTLGYERVVRSEKGMVTQRAKGIDEAKSEYILVLDDDLAFPDNFAEIMFDYLQNNCLDCTLAFGGWSGNEEGQNPIIEKTFKKMVSSKLKSCRGAFTGQHFVSKRSSKYFDVITTTAGHKTYINNPTGLCQTGAFACFFAKTQVAKSVHFEDEVWLQQGAMTSYAALDDAVFYYKIFLGGGRIAYANNTDYKHLDAAAGRQAKDKLDAKSIRLYIIARNRTIFWYKFLWKESKTLDKKIHVIFGGLFAFVNYSFYSSVINLYPKYWYAIGAMLRGYKDAFVVIRKML